MYKPPSIQRQFLAMDFLNFARDRGARPHTVRSYVFAARGEGLTTPEIAAGLGRSISFVEDLLTNGGI